MDPKYGIVAGTGTLYDTEGTTVKPGFIDENGMIVLDKDGMPRNSNFFLDLRDGSAYFRGTVYADGGRFKGSVYGDNYYFNDRGNVRTLINEAGVDFSKMKRIDLGGIVLDGETGNISFTGAGSITWGDNSPVKYQFSVDGKTGWHDTMQANDKYRRDSLDGGTTWGTPYQFRGTDGKNGSSANVTRRNIEQALEKASTISSSYIGVDSMGSPEIYGGKIYGTELYAGNTVDSNFAKVSSSGFELYQYGIEPPKFVVDVSESGDIITITMGAGNGSGVNKFKIEKLKDSARLYYEPSIGVQAGFKFNNNGTIDPLGKLKTTAIFA